MILVIYKHFVSKTIYCHPIAEAIVCGRWKTVRPERLYLYVGFVIAELRSDLQ